MGDANQLRFVEQHADVLQGPYLEVGARDYGSTQDLRRLFDDQDEYVRLDMIDGPGVDVVLDLTLPADQIDELLGRRRFGTVFCLSVLEHCREPFAMAENLTRLLRPGGRICLSVPFAWKFHGYPSDYWRFTAEGVKVLFPRLEFAPDECISATSRDGEFHPIDEQLAKIPFGTGPHWRQGRLLRGLSAKTLKLLSRVGLLRWLAGHRYVLAPTNLLMIGRLAGE